MKNILISCFVLLVSANVLAENSKPGEVQTWQLPQTLNDKNTKVSFEVGTTWHVVYGNISNTTGNISLSNPKEPLSVNSEIHFPVKNFSTGWDKRDESLLEHMNVEKYPEVVLKTNRVIGECAPTVVEKGPCSAKLAGTLTICDVTKDVEINIVISKKDGSFDVAGDYSFKWAEYNVEDPSIIVAKVDPTVKVKYSVTIPSAVPDNLIANSENSKKAK